MDDEQVRQEQQYGFPYHHTSGFKRGHFSQVRVQPWGYVYLSYVELVLEYIEKLSFTSLFDIGCGDGKFLYEARKRFPHASLYGNDYSEHAIAFAKAFNFANNVHLSTQPIEAVSREKGMFDVVTAIEVLEHIPLDETTSFCASFAAALAPGGTGIITVPSDNRPVSKKHYQHFNERSLRETVAPHLEVTGMFFLNDRTGLDRLIRTILSNRFFILNHAGAVNAVYRYYCRNLLRSTPERCTRLMALVRKKR